MLEIIKISVQKIKIGRPTYLNSYEEALVVASAEIEGSHWIPIDVNTLAAERQLVINSSQLTKINQRYHSQFIMQVYPLSNQASQF